MDTKLSDGDVEIHVPGSASTVPLCVDLDGTLVRSDLLLESLVQAIRSRLAVILALPYWLWKGRAHLKYMLGKFGAVDPATLPYDARTLQIINAARAAGRECVLVTASNRLHADSIAAHLNVFDRVIASDRRTNLAGKTKANALTSLFGDRGFDYIANNYVDLQVWSHARRAMVINAPYSLARRAARVCEVAAYHPREHFGLISWLRAIRVHQWLKNLLIFVPLITAHLFIEASSVAASAIAFFSFSICASSVYLTNDLFDLSADRIHPEKRNRPLASGALPIECGILMAPILLLAGLALAAAVSLQFVSTLCVYWLMTLAYSAKIKKIEVLDVSTLAALYTIRIIAGAVAISVTLSFWLLAFSMFLFFSLAALKRVIELAAADTPDKGLLRGRGYRTSDVPILRGIGVASGFVSLLVLALYINSPESIELYRHPMLLWLLCPVLLYWVSRIWLLADRGEVHHDPVVFAATDSTSWATAAIASIIILAAI